MIPTVNKSCCTLSPRTGSIVIAVAYIILMLLSVGHYQGFLDSSEDKDSGRLARTGASLVAVLMLVFCVIVLVGVFMRMSILLLIGGVAFFIAAVLNMVFGLLGFIDSGGRLELNINVLFALLTLYSAVVLWSHGKEL